jgi:hypothetical protein
MLCIRRESILGGFDDVRVDHETGRPEVGRGLIVTNSQLNDAKPVRFEQFADRTRKLTRYFLLGVPGHQQARKVVAVSSHYPRRARDAGLNPDGSTFGGCHAVEHSTDGVQR